jgi:GH15 family glucan-1,4-alpha-glucosidase
MSADAEGAGSASPGISDYALLGDSHGTALVSSAGSVDWWCPQRFDAASVFARLLDTDAGHWRIAPIKPFTVGRRYVEGTMVVESDLVTDQGAIRLTDALLLGTGERGHDVGYGSPHVLVRRIEGLRGVVDVEMELLARPEYGLVMPSVSAAEGRVEIAGGADRLTFTSGRPVQVQPGRGAVVADYLVCEGETVVVTLHHRSAGDPMGALLDGAAALTDTVAGWQSWTAAHPGYQGPYRDRVMRSALVLQALTYRPTGAVIAAATTSVPEVPGGAANWDYRFGWLRDGSFTLKALWVAACPDESERFFDWIAQSCGPLDGRDVPVMLGPGGERDLSERALHHLAGYDGAGPVRVGNDAWRQMQLDVYGEVLECAWILREKLGTPVPTTARLLRTLADRAAETWQQRDAGIWEGREGDRHYVTSKLMCWVALDRAVRLADQIDAADRLHRWEATRDQIRAAVLEEGWSQEREAFTGAFGSSHLDAGVLLIPLVGFLNATDPRVLSTLDVVEEELSRDGLVQRWTGAGDEGAFVICSYWLAAARAMAGQVDRARKIFETVTSHANDLGLLAEEIDIETGAQLGNFPQGLSHIGLINAAWEIAKATGVGTGPTSGQANDGKRRQEWES